MIGSNIPDRTRVLSVAVNDHVEASEFADAHRLAAGKAQRRIEVDQVVRRLGIAHLMAVRPPMLSGGWRQRVAIARARDEPAPAARGRAARRTSARRAGDPDRDLPLALGDEAGVVLEGVVGIRDPQRQLARLDVDARACTLWACDPGLRLGCRVGLRVLARDVSLTCTPQTGTSIGNPLRGTIEAIAADSHPAPALVRVRVGSAPTE